MNRGSHIKLEQDINSQKGISSTFYGKVMAFFALAVLSSGLAAYITSSYFLEFFIENYAITYVLYALELILVFTSRMWSKKIPLNRLLFVVFSAITGVTIAPLLGLLAQSPEGLAILIKALLASGLTFAAAAIYGYTTKKSLSGLGGFLGIALIGLIITSVIGIFITWSNTFEMIFSGIGVVIFAGFTVYDFNKIKSYPEDEYIDAALNIYLDIFNLFLFILRLLLSLSRD